MSVIEKYAGGRQPVKVWSPGLWVTVEATDPVVQIVDCNEENVGPCPAKDREANEAQAKKGQD